MFQACAVVDAKKTGGMFGEPRRMVNLSVFSPEAGAC